MPDPKAPKRRIVSVRVALTVDVDVDDYRLNYGLETVAAIRRDVRSAVLTAVTSGGVLADGIVDARLAGGSDG